jgi:glycosyltransferase involved in cell wall biosynthesis
MQIEVDMEKAFVTIVIPIRNEADFIERSLGAVLAQDYPADRMEILVVDGMSTDGTREIVRNLFERACESTMKRSNVQTFKRANLRLLDNPDQVVPTAMNVGIREARGDVIIRVDGHCEIPPDYVSTCVHYLQTTDADNVGGMQDPVGDGYMSEAIAVATSTPLFIGNAYFRYAEELRYVDTVYLGAYPKDVLDELGGYDEELVRHQDYELNCRLRNAGGKILYTPELKTTYVPRGSLWALAKQYFQYGVWKVRVMQKMANAFRARHFAPTLFTLFAVGGMPLSLALPMVWVRWLYVFGLTLYAVAAVTASIVEVAKRGRWKLLPVLPLAFATIHLSWGGGFWWGILRWNVFSSDE